MTSVDPVADATLFALEKPPPVSLADKFGVPPMSVLDRRMGHWQDRKRRWLSLGIESEVGRSGALTFNSTGSDPVSMQIAEISGGTSVFDPVVCELVYRWFSPAGGRVLDPFAGGSVRGVVASTLGRCYDGIDLRPEQIEANQGQAHLCSDIQPRWMEGDATRLECLDGVADEYDLLFSCPPYGDLEVYSDNPRDLSTMGYDEFTVAHGEAIDLASRFLRRNRFAVWVIGDVRDKRGFYRGLVHDTTRAFQSAGLRLLNDVVILDPVGTARLRAERPFVTTRKVTRVHQHMLVFVKGDPRTAASACDAQDVLFDEEAS